ncbi:hypothetical protein CGZ98_18730 [Enemella evansiae]|nr:hypothetical protein CGZ98_18730 [Enemella evansiae]
MIAIQRARRSNAPRRRTSSQASGTSGMSASAQRRVATVAAGMPGARPTRIGETERQSTPSRTASVGAVVLPVRVCSVVVVTGPV